MVLPIDVIDFKGRCVEYKFKVLIVIIFVVFDYPGGHAYVNNQTTVNIYVVKYNKIEYNRITLKL